MQIRYHAGLVAGPKAKMTGLLSTGSVDKSVDRTVLSTARVVSFHPFSYFAESLGTVQALDIAL
jgi:hypothetical protein